MIKFKAYRWLNVRLGARSFKKRGGLDGPVYVLVKGHKHTINKVLMAQGFIEEWPCGR